MYGVDGQQFLPPLIIDIKANDCVKDLWNVPNYTVVAVYRKKLQFQEDIMKRDGERRNWETQEKHDRHQEDRQAEWY